MPAVVSYTRHTMPLTSNEAFRLPPALVPVGSVLRREWRGEWYEVEVTHPFYPPLAGGRRARLRRAAERRAGHWRYVYAGRRYRSLSAIARVITGDRTYSGNRFFGLTPRRRGECRKPKLLPIL